MRRFLQARPRLAIGVKVALAVLAHTKPGGATGSYESLSRFSQGSKGKKAIQVVEDTVDAGMARAVSYGLTLKKGWGELVFAASGEIVSGTPMSYDEVRLWLQSYNAGPYACLKYKGDVPFRETRNYVPKVMKFYQQDLSGSEYDSIIVEKANKYGLDPQLIRAVIKAESDFNERTVSSAGARGLMQVMPVVWSEVKKRYNLKWNYNREVFNAEKNIEVACAYLAWLRYDFLPRHFSEFPVNPKAPALVKRDNKRTPVARISAREAALEKNTMQASAN